MKAFHQAGQDIENIFSTIFTLVFIEYWRIKL